MNKAGFLRMVVFASVLVVTVSFAGCVSSAPPYKGNSGMNMQGMTPYVQEGLINIMIPAGFKEVKIPAGQQKDVKAYFEREDESGKDVLTIICFGAFVNNLQLQEIMLSTLSPKSSVVQAPACLEEHASSFKPCFGRFHDVRVKEGEEQTVELWLGWKGTAGFDCKYGIIAGGAVSEDEFVATLRSIN